MPSRQISLTLLPQMTFHTPATSPTGKWGVTLSLEREIFPRGVTPKAADDTLNVSGQKSPSHAECKLPAAASDYRN